MSAASTDRTALGSWEKMKPTLEARRKRLIQEGSIKQTEYNPSRTRVVYFGKPCKYGHSGERYSSGHCVECHQARTAANSAKYRKDPAYQERQRMHERNSYRRRRLQRLDATQERK